MLKKGIYEKLINQEIERDIQNVEEDGLACLRGEMDEAESPKILASYLASLIQQRLEDVEEVEDRIKLVNHICSLMGMTDDKEIVQTNENLLMEVMTQQKSLLQKSSNSETIRPRSGFRVSNLFTGGNSNLSLGEEIRREIESADRIYFIVSFLKLSGLRIMLDDLRRFCEREGTSLRIITTTYCGITEAKALEQLAALPNSEIRISYNTDIERLHAKAYIFERNSEMHTAYIGSSNLSKSAQTDGLEWNIRVTNEENPHIIRTALATFDMYWNSPNFEDFRIGGIQKFNEELKKNSIKERDDTFIYQHYSLLPHQKQILDKLRVEREELGNNRNLIVAATGTGKTVMSAFDYLAFKNKKGGKRCNFLYIVHREEILKQSLSTYRSVLNDPNFGTLWVGSYSPKEESDYEHLFVSISMFNSRFEHFFANLPTDYYDYIVIDEAHHSQASSYRDLFSHFSPEILIGLTATPERMDGKDLRPDFGGHISAEIRLPQALQAGLLTPFQYLCITDNTDLSDESLWSGNRYLVERLSDRLCNRDRAKGIVTALSKYISDEHNCRALCFCVDKKHADFMAEQLRLYGFRAESLTSDTSKEERERLPKEFDEGRVNYLCVVDIFNEGIDIPSIDTALFLRPTESLTIFLQQLGRGLRIYPGKTELTVLDFVAQVNQKYDFASKFRALSLRPEKNIKDEIENGFSFLPSGCFITMEKMAKRYILENIKNAIYNLSRLTKDLTSYTSTPTIEQFLENNGQDIRILYRNNSCWTSLKRAAGKISYEDDSITKRLERGMGNLIHHNTASYIHFVDEFAKGGNEYREERYKTYSTMLYYDLFSERIGRAGFTDIYSALALIHDPKYHYFRDEISEIASYLLSHLEITTNPLGEDVIPGIELYGCYTREEIFTLTGRQTGERSMQGAASGVFSLDEYSATLLFVTLNKSEKDFSPSTQYKDYIIDETHFHWQSQNDDTHENRKGRRYTEQPNTHNKIILFVREEKRDGFGNTSPFHCFGPVNYVSSYGDRPMNITWRLEEPIMAQYMKAI